MTRSELKELLRELMYEGAEPGRQRCKEIQTQILDAFDARRESFRARTADGYERELYLTIGEGIDVIGVTDPAGGVHYYAAGPLRETVDAAELDAIKLEQARSMLEKP